MNVAIMKVWCKAFLNGKVTQTKDKSFQFCFHFKSFKCKRDLLCIRFTKLLSSAKCFRWKCLWHSKNLQNEFQKHCFFNFLIEIFLGHQNAHLRRDPLSPLLGSKIHHGIADENAILMVVLRTRLRHPDRPLFAPNDPCHSQSRRLLHHEQQLPKLRFGKMYRLSANLLPETTSSRKFRWFG